MKLRPGDMRHIKLLWAKYGRDVADEELLTLEQAGHVCSAEDPLVIASYEV